MALRKLSKEEYEAAKDAEHDADVVPIGKPDNIDNDTWLLIQDNGRLATERLNEILSSPRFSRMRPGDQAKLIKLAQDRAYGLPASNKGENKRPIVDVTAKELRDKANRAALPEYRKPST